MAYLFFHLGGGITDVSQTDLDLSAQIVGNLAGKMAFNQRALHSFNDFLAEELIIKIVVLRFLYLEAAKHTVSYPYPQPIGRIPHHLGFYV